MNHPAALPPVDLDPERIEESTTALIALDCEKAMCLVFWDGQPISFASDWDQVWHILESKYDGCTYAEHHTWSIAVMPFGGLGTDKVYSAHWPQAIWQANCESPDVLVMWMQMVGFIEDDHDGWERID